LRTIRLTPLEDSAKDDCRTKCDAGQSHPTTADEQNEHTTCGEHHAEDDHEDGVSTFVSYVLLHVRVQLIIRDHKELGFHFSANLRHRLTYLPVRPLELD